MLQELTVNVVNRSHLKKIWGLEIIELLLQSKQNVEHSEGGVEFTSDFGPENKFSLDPN